MVNYMDQLTVLDVKRCDSFFNNTFSTLFCLILLVHVNL